MATETPKRVARRPKSYRGCKACKTARKKCSEAKPACAFCIRNGLKCEYDIDCVLRFETFVDGKQPRRRPGIKIKDEHLPGGGRSSKESATPDDCSTVDPPLVAPEICESRAVKSEALAVIPCDLDTPDLADVSEISIPEWMLFRKQPSLFEHDSDDTPYIDYFFTQVKLVLPYFAMFPRITSEIFHRATVNRGLFHSVLSVSHLIADSRLKRSLVPAFHHEQQALGLIQKSISATDITEALAISVAMLVWLNIQQCNRPALNHHLRGLYLIFQEIQTKRYPGTEGPTPLLMQIWRFSIRLDLLASILYFPRHPLFPPVPMNQDHLHRHWIKLSTQTDHDTEWTLASLALDNLLHRTGHVAMKVYELRRSPNSARQIQQWISALLAEHAQWRTREIVVRAESYECKVNEGDSSLPGSCEGQFLEYPPLRVYDRLYANLLNTWRTIYILIDLMLVPEIGPARRNKRFAYAVETCRTFAALGPGDIFALGKVTAVFITGIAFGGRRRSPREAGWLYEKMIESLQMLFPLNRGSVTEYENLWETEGDYWDAIAGMNAASNSDGVLT